MDKARSVSYGGLRRNRVFPGQSPKLASRNSFRRGVNRSVCANLRFMLQPLKLQGATVALVAVR